MHHLYSMLLPCNWLVFNSYMYHRHIWILVVLVNCSLDGPLLYGTGPPAVVFLDRGHPCFWNFYSTVPVDVVRVMSYVNRLFDPVCVTMRITINKLCFIPNYVVSGIVGVLRGKSTCSLILSCIL